MPYNAASAAEIDKKLHINGFSRWDDDLGG